MKTIKILICTLVAFGFQLVSSAQVTVPVPVENVLSAEQVANTFGAAPMDYGRGWYYFNGVTNGVSKKINASFTLKRKDNRWGFTQLAINGKDLPIDPAYPLWELPPYVAGKVKNFQFSVQGYSKSGKETRNGWFYKNELVPSDEITVVLDLNYVRGTVPFELTGDQTANNVGIQSNDGNYGGYYDLDLGMFVISYNPLRLPKSWAVFDVRDNSVITTLPFKAPSDGTEVPDSGFGFALGLPDNISEISLDREGWSEGLQQLQMTSVVVRDGVSYSAKIVLVSVPSADGYVIVQGSGLQSGTVLEVHGISNDGSSKLVGRGVVQDEKGSWVRVEDNTGYLAYRAVFIGASDDPLNGISVYCYSSSSPQGDDGGGKGKPN